MATGDIDMVETAVADAISWLEANADASESEIQEQKQRVESQCQAIMAKVHGTPQSHEGAPQGDFKAPPEGRAKGPVVEEVD